MNAILTDIMAVIGVVLNGLPQGLLALSLGFASIPTAMAFFVGAVGNAVTQNVAPISFQAETITYAGTSGKNRSERCTMIFIGGVIMAIVGLTGTLTRIVDFIGVDIASGMMAGVGLILAKTAVDMIRSDRLSGFVSLVSALITYYIFRSSSNVLVYTILVSVVASCVASAIFQKGERKTIKVEDDNFKRQPFTFNTNVIIGALGMACLNIGSNISFGSITSAMAPNAHYNVDQLTFISSLADMCSSFFGGAPVESIISATAAAPHAVIAGIAMMVVIGVILLTGLLPKIGRYVPSSSIAGFLFVLGVFKTVCLDAPTALATAPAVGGLTMAVTAISNPFFGMLAGIAARLLGL
ncbi:MAG: NCS2 family permease [Lachnospiraceae bacterium]|jgi:AGZA family xanthine/uracil permease-like MFS transporter|nr:NCS2 family permease [Lachnospiraceae bacterium]MCH4031466.1 NCS2 family permease [Lachnospiraceae bacterium]MCH4071176.1 NCS2 family permease [Lachnospiraceae bacterium]MCH4108020.1 NCS2 family permease [Lachnospiraceae bacterium]MCI1302734.1 NCS2 family permease [Lachnospiraceae bacterium]